jgi:hypothetical protein
MNHSTRTLTLGALVLLTQAGIARAESPTIVDENFASTRTRAEVMAELAAYKKSGANPWSASFNPLRQFRSGTTREAVTAQFLASRDDVRALHGEDSGSTYLARARSLEVQTQWLAGQPRNPQ